MISSLISTCTLVLLATAGSVAKTHLSLDYVKYSSPESGAAAPQPKERRVGDFYVQSRIDPMSDEDRTIVTARAASGAVRALGWRCDRDGLQVMFTWNKYLSAGRIALITVEHRFPPAEAKALSWEISQDHRLGFMPATHVWDFTRQALQSESVTLRVTDPNGGEKITETFKLKGAADALKHLPCFDPQPKIIKELDPGSLPGVK